MKTEQRLNVATRIAVTISLVSASLLFASGSAWSARLHKLNNTIQSVKNQQSNRLAPASTHLTAGECASLDGRIIYSPSCSGTETSCTITRHDGKQVNMCVTKAAR